MHLIISWGETIGLHLIRLRTRPWPTLEASSFLSRWIRMGAAFHKFFYGEGDTYRRPSTVNTISGKIVAKAGDRQADTDAAARSPRKPDELQVAAPVAETKTPSSGGTRGGTSGGGSSQPTLRPLPRQPPRRSQDRSRSPVQMMAAEAEVEARHPAAGRRHPGCRHSILDHKMEYREKTR